MITLSKAGDHIRRPPVQFGSVSYCTVYGRVNSVYLLSAKGSVPPRGLAGAETQHAYMDEFVCISFALITTYKLPLINLNVHEIQKLRPA